MTTVIWSDIDSEYSKQEDGDIQRDTEVDAIFNSIRNILLTIQGERRMLPTFATNVYGLLFEPIDEVTARLIAEGIIQAIRIWEDRIEMESFDIEPLYDQNQYKCRMSFTIRGSDELETVEFILTR